MLPALGTHSLNHWTATEVPNMLFLNEEIGDRNQGSGLPWWLSGKESACQCFPFLGFQFRDKLLRNMDFCLLLCRRVENNDK